MAECVKLPKSIVDKSWDLYKQVQKSIQLKTFTNDAIATACVYIADRQEKYVLSFKNIRHASKCNNKAIGKCFVSILNLLNIKLEPVYTDPFVNSLCNDLDLPPHVKRISHHIVLAAETMKIVPQCDRQAIIAAAIFMASQVSRDKRTQKDVENISGVAGEAISEAYRCMYPHASDLIPINLELIAHIQALPRI